MAKINLVDSFKAISTGNNQVLTISKVTFDSKFKKLKLVFEDNSGGTLTEQYDLTKEVVLKIVSNIVKCATHDFSNREIDPEAIAGLSVLADVYDQETESGAVYTHVRRIREVPIEDESEDDIDVDEYL